MAKFVIFLVLVSIVSVSYAGTIAYQHRDTTLDELKAIDSYVSSALPVLQDGFFIGTSRGPVLVKSGAPPGVNSRPTVRSKYYNTLPRLIPAGFEGIAISHFNLGAANPIQPITFPKTLLSATASHPVTQHQHQPQQYIETGPAIQSEQYIDQSQQIYEQPAQNQINQQQYVAEAQEPQQYITQPQAPQQPQQLFQYPQQYFVPPPQQLDAQQSVQEPTQIASRSETQTLNSQSSPASFQVDNLLRDQEQVTAYQTQVFGEERFQSQKLLPNAAVVATSEYEDALPDTLRNKFYRNANLAQILAQESLPVQGEQIIGGDWDTNKIGKGKIHALLRGAGLI